MHISTVITRTKFLVIFLLKWKRSCMCVLHGSPELLIKISLNLSGILHSGCLTSVAVFIYRINLQQTVWSKIILYTPPVFYHLIGNVKFWKKRLNDLRLYAMANRHKYVHAIYCLSIIISLLPNIRDSWVCQEIFPLYTFLLTTPVGNHYIFFIQITTLYL